MYVTHFIILSSRLFVICYFNVSYKWWVVALLMFHSCVVLITTFIQNRDKVDWDSYCNFSTILFIGIHCLRYDFVELSINVEVIGITMSVYFSQIFVSIRKPLYDLHVLFHLSPQRLVLFTCHCVCLCGKFLSSLDACLPIENLKACVTRFVISQSTRVTQNNYESVTTIKCRGETRYRTHIARRKAPILSKCSFLLSLITGFTSTQFQLHPSFFHSVGLSVGFS